MTYTITENPQLPDSRAERFTIAGGTYWQGNRSSVHVSFCDGEGGFVNLMDDYGVNAISLPMDAWLKLVAHIAERTTP